jgi:hypothetical protein
MPEYQFYQDVMDAISHAVDIVDAFWQHQQAGALAVETVLEEKSSSEEKPTRLTSSAMQRRKPLPLAVKQVVWLSTPPPPTPSTTVATGQDGFFNRRASPARPPALDAIAMTPQVMSQEGVQRFSGDDLDNFISSLSCGRT